jgi:hypothetical protein
VLKYITVHSPAILECAKGEIAEEVNNFKDYWPNRLLKNDFSCFEGLSMNGKSPMFSTPAPFALSLSKGKRGVFQHPAKRDNAA